ncbi:TRAP transporter permease [Lentibacillus halophilus]|uniref:TRAP transporter permease n=1 Tax=Lentibacillus halophilus TaxID=295065 RepID=A0ABP3JC09_9BACI
MKNNNKENNEKTDDNDSGIEKFRQYLGPMAKIVTVIAIFWSLFQLFITGFGVVEAIKLRAWYFGFMSILVFLLFPAKKKDKKQRRLPTLWDIICIIAVISSVGYFLMMYDAYVMDRGGLHISADYWFGAVGILMVFEASRRAAGLPMTLLAVIFLLYNFFGQYIPGTLGHVGFDYTRIIDVMWWGTEGIFGVVAGVAATYIFMFILFGSFLKRSGFIKFVNDFALAISGRSAGGPAKVAVIGSGMMGTINGSGIANASTVGTFTIPMMIRTGYKPYFAGAVEAVSGTGGVLAPPVMGAASFIMATFLGMDYRLIILAAVIPAVLYFTMCFMSVHFEAKKQGLEGLSKEDIPKFKDVIKNSHLLLPVAILVYMLVTGVTPIFAALWAIVTTVIASWLRKETRMHLKDILNALEEGAKNVLVVSAACMVVGVVVGTISLTSVGLVVGNNILSLAGGSVFIAAILTMLLTILLGTGVPVTASYIIATTISAPILAEMGVPLLVSHMFVFFFAALSEITPPVALAALVTSGIAGAKFAKVSLTAVRLGIIGFVIPFFFLYNPELLFIEGSFSKSIIAMITGIIGVIALAGAMSNWFLTKPNLIQQLLLAVSGIGLILPSYIMSFMSLAVMLFIIFWQIKNKRSQMNNEKETSISV